MNEREVAVVKLSEIEAVERSASAARTGRY